MADNSAQDIGWQAVSDSGVVAAGGADAVAAGIHILEQDGNAADAAAATIFALNITDHVACSIGGEVPLLFYSADKRKVTVLSGQGRAPLSQDAIDWYMANGIPKDDMKMAPVPAVVDLCITTLIRYGTKSLSEVLAPTLTLLDEGTEPWHPNLAVTLSKLIDEEARTTGSRSEKLQAASDRFYGRIPGRTDIADDLEAFYSENGGFLRKADLAAHTTPIEDPVTVVYRGYTVYKCGPWTQGPYLLQALRLLEGYDLTAMGHLSSDYIHVVAEALKLALADRDTYYADPDFVDVPLAALLSDAYTQLRRPLIDMERASQIARPGDPYGMKPLVGDGVLHPGIGGTTTCVIADRWGNVVAATPSANVYGNEGGRAGVTFGNRLLSLNTTPGHPNCIQAGKRPRITLTPTLVLKENRPVLAVSVAGGDRQDQATLELLLNHIEFGMLPAEAVTTPRFQTGHHQDSFDPNPQREQTIKQFGSLTINSSVDTDTRDELARRGHQVEAADTPIATPVMLYVDGESGRYYAAGDPAARRHAAGLS